MEEEEEERETERIGLMERETEHWRNFETAWVVKMAVGIERPSISITWINGINTTSIKWDINRFGVVLKFA